MHANLIKINVYIYLISTIDISPTIRVWSERMASLKISRRDLSTECTCEQTLLVGEISTFVCKCVRIVLLFEA